jgi:nitrite reductase (NADH) small subunit
MTDVLIRTWTDVCDLAQLEVGRGVAAVVGDQQVALFRWDDDTVYALSNLDPFSNAYVMSRGIVGSRGEIRKVASPLYKDNFDLETGACLDDPTQGLTSFPVRIVDGRVEVGCP